jgi:hypothetical protein
MVCRGKTTRELPFSEFLHRGQVHGVDELLFSGTPRTKRMKFQASLPPGRRVHAGDARVPVTNP